MPPAWTMSAPAIVAASRSPSPAPAAAMVQLARSSASTAAVAARRSSREHRPPKLLPYMEELAHGHSDVVTRPQRRGRGRGGGRGGRVGVTRDHTHVDEDDGSATNVDVRSECANARDGAMQKRAHVQVMTRAEHVARRATGGAPPPPQQPQARQEAPAPPPPPTQPDTAQEQDAMAVDEPQAQQQERQDAAVAAPAGSGGDVDDGSDRWATELVSRFIELRAADGSVNAAVLQRSFIACMQLSIDTGCVDSSVMYQAVVWSMLRLGIRRVYLECVGAASEAPTPRQSTTEVGVVSRVIAELCDRVARHVSSGLSTLYEPVLYAMRCVLADVDPASGIRGDWFDADRLLLWCGALHTRPDMRRLLTITRDITRWSRFTEYERRPNNVSINGVAEGTLERFRGLIDDTTSSLSMRGVKITRAIVSVVTHSSHPDGICESTTRDVCGLCDDELVNASFVYRNDDMDCCPVLGRTDGTTSTHTPLCNCRHFVCDRCFHQCVASSIANAVALESASLRFESACLDGDGVWIAGMNRTEIERVRRLTTMALQQLRACVVPCPRCGHATCAFGYRRYRVTDRLSTSQHRAEHPDLCDDAPPAADSPGAGGDDAADGDSGSGSGAGTESGSGIAGAGDADGAAPTQQQDARSAAASPELQPSIDDEADTASDAGTDATVPAPEQQDCFDFDRLVPVGTPDGPPYGDALPMRAYTAMPWAVPTTAGGDAHAAAMDELSWPGEPEPLFASPSDTQEAPASPPHEGMVGAVLRHVDLASVSTSAGNETPRVVPALLSTFERVDPCDSGDDLGDPADCEAAILAGLANQAGCDACPICELERRGELQLDVDVRCGRTLCDAHARVFGHATRERSCDGSSSDEETIDEGCVERGTSAFAGGADRAGQYDGTVADRVAFAVRTRHMPAAATASLGPPVQLKPVTEELRERVARRHRPVTQIDSGLRELCREGRVPSLGSLARLDKELRVVTGIDPPESGLPTVAALCGPQLEAPPVGSAAVEQSEECLTVAAITEADGALDRVYGGHLHTFQQSDAGGPPVHNAVLLV